MKEHKVNFDLITILPFLVWGPSLSPGPSESLKVIENLLNGTFPVIMSLEFGFVDVRDVALAHVLAIEKPNASGRYICFDKKLNMKNLVQAIRNVIPNPAYGARLPTASADCGPGDALLKFAANFQPSGTRDYLQHNVGKTIKWDPSKIKRDLGIEFRSETETITDTVNFLIETGQVSLKGK